MKRSRAFAPSSATGRCAVLPFVVYSISGFCLLSFETIWIRTLASQSGGTIFSGCVAISVFFIFAALGNLVGARRVHYFANSFHAYAVCEICVAMSAMCCFALSHYFISVLGISISTIALRHFICAAALLGLPAFFSGAAFPFLSEALLRREDQRVSVVGPVYAGNLVGAAFGAIFGGVCLPELLGNSGAFYCIAILLCCVGLWVLRWPYVLPRAAFAVADQPRTLSNEAIGVLILIASGVLSMNLEILTLTYFRQFTSQSVYCAASVLFAFVVNFGVAAWLAARLSRRISSARLIGWCLALAGICCVAYMFVLQFALEISRPMFSPSSAGPVFVLTALATLLFAPLHIPCGMVYPLAWTLVKRGENHQGAALGNITAWNKAGSAVGAFVGPFLLFPLASIPGTMLLSGISYLFLAAISGMVLLDYPFARRLVIFSAAGCLIATLAFFARKPLVESSNTLLAEYNGANGIVAVTVDSNGSRRIVVNNVYALNGTERALLSQKQECWLPLALCDDPHRVAFVGMASGISAAAALDFPITGLDAIELIPEVAAAARDQFKPWNEKLFSDPRVAVHINDGRASIRSSGADYDLIVCDLFFPAQEGTSSLYSREFFSSARSKLSPRGKFCLWLPLYQFDAELAGIVIHTFLDAFPNAIAIRGNMNPLQPILGLVGSGEPFDLSNAFLSRRLGDPCIQKLKGECAFLRSVSNYRLTLLGDLQSVRKEFDSFALNTDDNSVFAFKGARDIPRSQILNGNNFLHWFGLKFLQSSYPSCTLGTTPPEELLAGIRAGNHLFAASVTSVNLPGMDRQIERARETLDHMKVAGALSPLCDVRQDELGQ